MARIQMNKEALKKTDAEFYTRHPERRDRPITANAADAALRAEWLAIYRKHAGNDAVTTRSGQRPAQICGAGNDKKGVFVYLYVAGADGHGHVGLVLEQRDGSLIRYSQAAENPNLHGKDTLEYMLWMQKVVVRTKRFPKGVPLASVAPGSKMIRIPTKYPHSVQAAVDKYIADKTHYNVVTNNCADFVNDTINAADDVDVSDQTRPIDYYSSLLTKYPGCAVTP